MEASEVRRRIVADHVRLRQDADRVEICARRLLDDLGMPLSALKTEGEGLLELLFAHMRWEEAYLLPALLEADAWGAERAASLVRDHRDQRSLLEFALARLRDAERPADMVARDLLALVDLLRADMRAEERDLLDERVLRDDVVGIAVEVG